MPTRRTFTGVMGVSHNPAGMGVGGLRQAQDESQFRYEMGPKNKIDVEAYNSYFEEHGVDLIMIPTTRAATPDLADLASGTVPMTPLPGEGPDRPKTAIVWHYIKGIEDGS